MRSAAFLKAALAFLVLPGMVAFAVPLLVLTPDRPPAFAVWPAAPLLVAGSFLLLWCVRDFYVEGKGTLAPWWRLGFISASYSARSRGSLADTEKRGALPRQGSALAGPALTRRRYLLRRMISF